MSRSEMPAPQRISTGSRHDFDLRCTRYVTDTGHGAWLGLRYHAHGDNWMELELPWDAKLRWTDAQSCGIT